MKLKVNAVFDDLKEDARREIGEVFEATVAVFKEHEEKLPGRVEVVKEEDDV